MTILFTYILVSCAVAMLWLDVYRMDNETKIYISTSLMKEYIEELDLGKKQMLMFKTMAVLYNFFILPWALIGITYRLFKGAGK